jgi:DNA-binding NarL/FixJ family response regulator
MRRSEEPWVVSFALRVTYSNAFCLPGIFSLGLQTLERAERTKIRALLDRLTPREREVLELVILGKLNKQIAAELGTSEKTVKVHRGRVMKKMQVFSVAELVRLTEEARIRPGTLRDGTKV